jgi:hypothetical protein
VLESFDQIGVAATEAAALEPFRHDSQECYGAKALDSNAHLLSMAPLHVRSD